MTNGRKEWRYTLDEVLISLRKKRDCRVSIESKVVYVLRDSIWSDKLERTVDNPIYTGDIGNKSWGKIDYLKKIHCYAVIRVPKF